MLSRVRTLGSESSIPCVRVAPAQSFTPQFFGAGSLDVQSARFSGAVGNFDPAAACMGSSSSRYPDHVLPFFLACACLRCGGWSQIKIELCRLIRLCLCIRD